MPYSREELLPAIVLSGVAEVGDYVGPATGLTELVRNRWGTDYSDEEIMFAVTLFAGIGDATFADSGNPEDFIRVSSGDLKARLRQSGWKESQPALHYYSHFGVEWLEREWARSEPRTHISSPPAGDELEATDPTTEPLTVGSTEWTGLPANFALTEDTRAELVSLLRQAEDGLNGLAASNHEKAQARAFIVAARMLAEAPDPPVELIWQLIGRANSIAGIASLLVSIIALFT